MPWYRIRKNSELVSLFFIALLLLVSLSACEREVQLEPMMLEGSTMGTYYRVTLVNPGDYSADILRSNIDAELDAVNRAMSTYLTGSEISEVNRAPADQRLQLSNEFATVLRAALDLAGETAGRFDPTVGPLVQLWGFGSKGRIVEPPNQDEIEETLQGVGYQHLRLNGPVLEKLHSDVEIDLSAIAKGFAIDQIAEQLEALGLTNWLIDIGGEMRSKGENSGRPWRIAIEVPTAEGGIQQVVPLAETAIATSGDYRNFFEVNGRRYSHAVDPTTGYPIDDGLASVTVLHPSAMMADGLATALLVMGLEKATEFAQAKNLSGYFIARDGNDGFHTHVTGDFVSLAE